MGTYLATGIVNEIRIRKKDVQSEKILLEDIIKSLTCGKRYSRLGMLAPTHKWLEGTIWAFLALFNRRF